jgi:hypothetical protein
MTQLHEVRDASAVQPALHSTPQIPLAHVARPFAGTTHARPHAPQFERSVEVATQAVPQSAVPAGQAVEQLPELHDTLPPDGAVHTRPHAPQLFASFANETHAVPHRSSPAAQPFVHAYIPPLALHIAALAEHVVVQAPQCEASARLASHPSDGVPLQSAKPALQEEPHAPVLHRAVPFTGAAQLVAHEPQ